jgi:hypothetical protein
LAKLNLALGYHEEEISFGLVVDRNDASGFISAPLG